jgi:LPS-assembly lipoprotein
MWWSRRATLLTLAGAGLTACGFTPLLGDGGAAPGLRGAILPDEPDTRTDFRFATRLEQRLGRADTPRYALGYRIELGSEDVALTPENVALRVRVTGRLIWSLRPVAGGDPVAGGTLATFTAYTASSTTVATRTARQAAEDRLAEALADLLVTDLYARAATLGGPAP